MWVLGLVAACAGAGGYVSWLMWLFDDDRIDRKLDREGR